MRIGRFILSFFLLTLGRAYAMEIEDPFRYGPIRDIPDYTLLTAYDLSFLDSISNCTDEQYLILRTRAISAICGGLKKPEDFAFHTLTKCDYYFIEKLLEFGLNADTCLDIIDKPPLIMHATAVPIAELLLRKGARLTATTENKKTVLHMASCFKYPEDLLEFYLSKQTVDVNACDVRGETPFHEWAHCGMPPCGSKEFMQSYIPRARKKMQAFIKAGAKANAENIRGRRAWDILKNKFSRSYFTHDVGSDLFKQLTGSKEGLD